jgi:hypothetical protein
MRLKCEHFVERLKQSIASPHNSKLARSPFSAAPKQRSLPISVGEFSLKVITV